MLLGRRTFLHASATAAGGSNSVVTLGTAYGFLRASQNFAIYATVGVIAGIFSLVIGTCFVAGLSLPHFGRFFGG